MQGIMRLQATQGNEKHTMHTIHHLPRQRGFSLVELSIVLVILGLLVGGVLGGRSLIRASELRSITTQYNNYYSATRAFRDKYFALPGDMTNATSFWGAAAAPGTCATTAGTGAATCDGDGDGLITSIVGSKETHRFWQHLANAGMIEGSYQGISAAPAPETSINLPPGKVGHSFWSVGNLGLVSAGAYVMFAGDYGNLFEIGSGCATSAVNCPLLNPEEVWNIDTKMDDGKPATGKLVVDTVNGVEFCTDAPGGGGHTSDRQLSAFF